MTIFWVQTVFIGHVAKKIHMLVNFKPKSQLWIHEKLTLKKKVPSDTVMLLKTGYKITGSML